LPEPNNADVARAEARFGHADLAQLQEGRRLYLARCGTCHALREPLSLEPDAWVAQVHDMRVNKGAHISPTEETRIDEYLVSISSR
jgi:mono/diheme cytochrome c family protein